MKKSIGILGGMGPLATADLLRKIVLMTKAEKDGDHVRVYIDDNPNIPDRTAAILSGGASPLAQMEDSLQKLALCGADCIIMPCNTAHYFLPALQEKTQIPFISMLEATAKACARRHRGGCAAVLATKGTLATGLYAEALAREGVTYLIPNEEEQNVLMHIIYDVVKAGKPLAPERESWAALLSNLRARGADYFILGCTELPIAAQSLDAAGPFVDPTEELARAALTFCGYETADAAT